MATDLPIDKPIILKIFYNLQTDKIFMYYCNWNSSISQRLDNPSLRVVLYVLNVLHNNFSLYNLDNF